MQTVSDQFAPLGHQFFHEAVHRVHPLDDRELDSQRIAKTEVSGHLLGRQAPPNG